MSTAAKVQAKNNSYQELMQLIVEAIGTFALIFIGVSSIVMTQGKPEALVVVGLAHGLAIALMVAATGHISGGAFNPAVTLGLWIGRQLSATKAASYVVAQIMGATMGALAVEVIFPDTSVRAVSLGIPAVGSGFTVVAAFVAEVITTFFLVYVIFGVAVDKRGPSTIAGLAIGLCITMDIYATGAVSGAAMNPARWLGPALVLSHFNDGWIWVLAPAVGASLAAVLYFYGYLRGGKAPAAS